MLTLGVACGPRTTVCHLRHFLIKAPIWTSSHMEMDYCPLDLLNTIYFSIFKGEFRYFQSACLYFSEVAISTFYL